MDSTRLSGLQSRSLTGLLFGMLYDCPRACGKSCPLYSVRQIDLAEPLFKGAPGTVRIVDAQTVYMRLEKSYFAADTLLAILRKLLNKD